MAEKSDKLQFAIMSNMPMGTRLGWIAGLLLGGFAIQLTISVFLGWLVFLAGCLLGIIRSKSTEPSVGGKGDWSTTTIEELEQIEALSIRIRNWRERTNAFRATSGGGCAMLLFGLIGLFVSTLLIAVFIDRAQDALLVLGMVFVPPLRGGFVAPIWAVDGLTLMILIWFAGSISAWEPPELPRKARYLLDIREKYKSQPELEFLPSLYVQTKDDRAVPTDCRLMIKFKDAPKEFMGVQVQISLNDVQGTKYPYAYAVILAKKGFGLTKKAAPYLEEGEGGGLLGLFKSAADRKELEEKQFAGSVAEIESQPDVDVVVVRQVAAGEGYKTSEEQALEVISDALNLAQMVLKG